MIVFARPVILGAATGAVGRAGDSPARQKNKQVIDGSMDEWINGSMD